MTTFEEFAEKTAKLTQAVTRLETLERRHRVLVEAFARLERGARSRHERGRSAAKEIARLARLERWMTRGEAETLAIVERVLPLMTADDDHG